MSENPRHLLQYFSKTKLPVILQAEATECGLASLAMIAGYYGFSTNLTQLRKRFSISLKGANLLDLMAIAEQLKLSSRPVKVELNKLYKLKKPAILHWDMNHFVVLKKVNKDSIEIHDPAVGHKRLAFDEASKHFTGVALEVIPSEGFERQDERIKMKLSDFWNKIHGLGSSLGKIFILSMLLQVFALAAPYYMQLVVDDVVISADRSLLVILAIGFFLLMLIGVITQAMRGLVTMHLGNQLNIQIAANLFRHLIRLPLEYFEKRHMGDVVSRFNSLQQVREILTTGLVEAIIDGVMAITTCIMIFIYSPALSFIVVTSVLIYMTIRLLLFPTLRRLSEEAIMAQAKQQSNFMETVRGIQSIKLFGGEIQRQTLWHNCYADALNSGIRVGNVNIGYSTVNQFLFGLENVLVIYVAATLVINGDLTIGMLFAFMAYKAQFSSKMANLIEKLIQFKMLDLHFERLADIAKTEVEKNLVAFSKATPINEQLELKNISFRYSQNEELTLDNLNVKIHSGESVAIIGPSGCGKSTLMKVMLGLFQPEEGTVTFGGVNINSIGLSAYRNQIGAVMQDDQLLSGSIAENIAFFSAEIDLEKVKKSAELASIHEDIANMSMGYNTLIGDMGTALSGGQKQRLILARALYRNPKILFMDEATSHLDTSLESRVNEAMQQLNITRIIIAHRPETIASADRILLLKNGKIFESVKSDDTNLNIPLNDVSLVTNISSN